MAGPRHAFILRYDRPRPELTPPPGVRDAGGKYRASGRGRPVGPEAILHVAWRNAGLERASVRGRDGHVYRIIYSGKPGGSFGPDFTDAVVERDDGTVIRGDIEIHVRESDWRAHGHHRDPRYNGVVLHVVAAASKGRPAVRATGTSIPLLALNWKAVKPRLNSGGRRAGEAKGEAGVPESAEVRPEPVNAGIKYSKPLTAPMGPLGVLDLATAGLERFHAQAAGIALEIESFGADQAVWLGVMGALGYPRNKRAFRMLATRVPWRAVAGCSDPGELESLLMRAAGLGAGHPPPRGSGASATDPQGRPPDWVRPWGRPANSPVARIRAISALVPIWARGGGIASASAAWVASAARPGDLAGMFRPDELVGIATATVMGSARAAEIVVNVLLPTVFATATRTCGASPHAMPPELVGLKNRALELYGAHPRLAGNSLTEEAKIALGVDYTVPKIGSARDQQGLIALYRQMTRRGIRPRQARLPGI